MTRPAHSDPLFTALVALMTVMVAASGPTVSRREAPKIA